MKKKNGTKAQSAKPPTLTMVNDAPIGVEEQNEKTEEENGAEG